MTTVTFDTYKFVRKLRDSGLTEQQAEAIANTIIGAHDDLDLATKADLKAGLWELKTELKSDISELKFDLLKWVIGLTLAQIGLLLGILLKLLPT